MLNTLFWTPRCHTYADTLVTAKSKTALPFLNIKVERFYKEQLSLSLVAKALGISIHSSIKHNKPISVNYDMKYPKKNSLHAENP